MRRQSLLPAAATTLAFWMTGVCVAGGSGDVSLLRDQMIEWYGRGAPRAGVVERYIHGQRPDGSWPDIDYANTDPGGWRTYEHLGRTLEMARVYRAAGHPMADNPALRAAVVAAIEHWTNEDYVNSNWWYPQIGVPDALAPTLVLMAEAAPGDLRDKAIRQILGRSKMGMTGQNKVWLAGIAFMKGLLCDDAAMMREARNQIFEELHVTIQEGIQPDYSFHQHGPQLQWGNYGAAFSADMIQWASIFRDTDYALTPEQIDLLGRYLLEGTAWIVWNGRMDISGCGRQIFRDCQASKGRSVIRHLDLMAEIDPTRANLYRDAIACNQPGQANTFVAHKHFWRSDISVQRRPNWYASVKMCSTRVIGAETCNNENMLGLHLGDGVTYFQRTGQEYEDLFPVWDWRRLPGTTCEQDQGTLVPSSALCRGRSDFVGGVSGGRCGLAAMEYLRDGLSARKAWFFLEDAVVCLGAGIACDTPETVLTSVNQCAANGPVTISVDRRLGHLSKGQRSTGPHEWLHHDGMGYVFLTPGKTTAGVLTQTGTWHDVHRRESTQPVERDVFNLWIDHGARPDAEQYAYVVCPDVSVEAMRRLSEAPPARIVAQSNELLAIVSHDGKLLQAAFFRPGQVTWGDGRTLAVDEPALVMLDETRVFPRLRVCDPTQKRKALRVRLSWYSKAEIVVPLPEGGFAGQTVDVNLH
ncbi:MAG: polysaccharide lyase 8 family protein [Phycisphaerae bacterium]|nr:polysaccharide lyase 8 family protein [Phycisphaerae bacterium]